MFLLTKRSFLNLVLSIFSIVSILFFGQVLAGPPSATDLSRWVQNSQLQAIIREMERYQGEVLNAVEQADQFAQSHLKSPKTKNEKETIVNGKLKIVLNRRDHFGLTLLHWAAFAHAIDNNSGKEVFEYLLENGADPMLTLPSMTHLQMKDFRAFLLSLGTKWSSRSDLFILVHDLIPFYFLFLHRESSDEVLLPFIKHMDPSVFSQPIGRGESSGEYFIDSPLLSEYIYRSNWTVAEALIRAGVDVNCFSRRLGGDALWTVFKLGLESIYLERKKLFHVVSLGSVVDEKLVNELYSPNSSLLAAQKKMITLLIAHGANPFQSKVMLIEESGRFQFVPLLLQLRKMNNRQLEQWILKESLNSPIFEVKALAELYLKQQASAHEKAEQDLIAWVDEQERLSVTAVKQSSVELSNASVVRRTAVSKRAADFVQSGCDDQDENCQPDAKGVVEKSVEGDLEGAELNTEDSMGRWEVVERKKATRSLRGLILPVSLNGGSIPVRFDEAFYRHVFRRDSEVGNHDLTDEEICEVLNSTKSTALRQERSDQSIRYLFIYPMYNGEYMRVVIGKRAIQSEFVAITAFRSSALPVNFTEELSGY